MSKSHVKIPLLNDRKKIHKNRERFQHIFEGGGRFSGWPKYIPLCWYLPTIHFSGVLCRFVVPGRVLVLLCLYPHDAGHVRVHLGPTADQAQRKTQKLVFFVFIHVVLPLKMEGSGFLLLIHIFLSLKNQIQSKLFNSGLWFYYKKSLFFSYLELKPSNRQKLPEVVQLGQMLLVKLQGY